MLDDPADRAVEFRLSAPRAKLLRLSLTSALGLNVLPKGPKIGC